METAFRLAPATEQGAVRLRAVEAVLLGERRDAVARRYGVTRQSLHSWLRKYRLHGPEGLVTRGPGRTERPALTPEEEGAVIGTITSLPPWRAGVPCSCWTRKAVAVFVERRHGVRASWWQIDRMLRRWGFRAHKEVRRAFRRRPPEVAALLERARALRDNDTPCVQGQ